MKNRRSRAFAAALTLAWFASLADAAMRDLRGTVLLVGKDGKTVDRAADPRGAVVMFRPAKPVQQIATSRTYQMATRKKEFEPRMLVVPAGATVVFPNQDPILHNVFSVSGENRFDLGLYRQGPGKSATFKRSGLVRVFCNVHQSMAATIAVVDTPYSTSPDASGAFQLRIPEGAGKLEVWHEQTDPVVIEVGPRGDAAAVEARAVVTRPRVPQHLNKLGRPYDRGRADYN
jgi:plastocyanin